MRLISIVAPLFFAFANADPCPDGYSQPPGGGDCYKITEYYDYFYGELRAKTYAQAELDCSAAGGGMLASIHSHEENEFILELFDGANPNLIHCGSPGHFSANIGLRCVGKACKWDDGSPLTFTNFDESGGPSDDGNVRCYGMDQDLVWRPRSCDATYTECWACSVKAITMQCQAGETAYKGGCVSLHTSPLDLISAEASCPDGGHLVSIHSLDEDIFYYQIARAAGFTGTIYIGGRFSDTGKFEWIDGSVFTYNRWAQGFPNPIFGMCAQMLLDSQWMEWTNIDCTVKQQYMCIRNGGIYGPTASPPPPEAEARCPEIQYYTESGHIYSPNYPASIPNQQSCEYIIESKEGTQASVNFPAYNCRAGTSLSLYDDVDSDQPFITFTSPPPPPSRWYTATTNVMKIIFSVNETSAPLGTGWEAEFTGK